MTDYSFFDVVWVCIKNYGPKALIDIEKSIWLKRLFVLETSFIKLSIIKKDKNSIFQVY